MRSSDTWWKKGRSIRMEWMASHWVQTWENSTNMSIKEAHTGWTEPMQDHTRTPPSYHHPQLHHSTIEITQVPGHDHRWEPQLQGIRGLCICKRNKVHTSMHEGDPTDKRNAWKGNEMAVRRNHTAKNALHSRHVVFRPCFKRERETERG